MALPTPDISVYVHADYAETKWLLTTSVTSWSRLVIPLSHGQPNGCKINFIQRGINVIYEHITAILCHHVDYLRHAVNTTRNNLAKGLLLLLLFFVNWFFWVWFKMRTTSRKWAKFWNCYRDTYMFSQIPKRKWAFSQMVNQFHMILPNFIKFYSEMIS